MPAFVYTISLGSGNTRIEGYRSTGLLQSTKIPVIPITRQKVHKMSRTSSGRQPEREG